MIFTPGRPKRRGKRVHVLFAIVADLRFEFREECRDVQQVVHVTVRRLRERESRVCGVGVGEG